MHPFLAKVTSDELLHELKQREAFGRAAEPWEVANVMVFLASDYASYLTGEVVSVSSQQPRPDDSTQPSAPPVATSCCDRGRAVRREGLQEHHRPRHRRRRGHPLRQPLPPLRLQGVDGRRDPVDVPGGAVRRSTTRSWPATTTRAPSSSGRCGCRSRRSTSTATRWRSSRTRRTTCSRFDRFAYLAERNAAVARGVDDAAHRRASTPACCATTSTSSSPTASSATPSGSRSPGTAPAARCTPHRDRRPVPDHPPRRDRHMPEAYIVDAVRTPVGKRGGALAGVHSADLARAHAARR